MIKNIEKDVKYFIDLGTARNIAKVKLNGIEVGGAWTPPYRLELTKALKKGNNKLEIKVTNNWVNRLIGDSRLPKERRQTSALFGPDQAEGLESSGLFGPVKIELIAR
ncbi:MAG: hypothetical protein EOO89_13015 [Pedobacter sp.]|nr:MAG: hypothetical protein EOO89_13015 [Pedobacter sp.]